MSILIPSLFVIFFGWLLWRMQIKLAKQSAIIYEEHETPLKKMESYLKNEGPLGDFIQTHKVTSEDEALALWEKLKEEGRQYIKIFTHSFRVPI